MEKVKKFVVLPVGLFIMKLTPLSFYRDPWRYLSNFRLDFWQKLGYFFLNLLGSAAYIFLLALLFLIVFTKINAAELFKKPALKAMGLVFAAELAIKFFLDDVIMPLLNRAELEAARQGAVMNEWYYVAKQLPSFIVGFVVIYFTLRLLIKPLNLHFSFHKTAFWIVAFICIAAVTIYSFYTLWLIVTVNQINASGNGVFAVTVLGITIDGDLYNRVSLFCTGVVTVLVDWSIISFFGRCTEQNLVGPNNETLLHN